MGDEFSVTLDSDVEGAIEVLSVDSSGMTNSILTIDNVTGGGIENGTFTIQPDFDYLYEIDINSPLDTEANYTLTTEII